MILKLLNIYQHVGCPDLGSRGGSSTILQFGKTERHLTSMCGWLQIPRSLVFFLIIKLSSLHVYRISNLQHGWSFVFQFAARAVRSIWAMSGFENLELPLILQAWFQFDYHPISN